MSKRKTNDSFRVLFLVSTLYVATLIGNYHTVFSAEDNIESQLFKKIETAAGINKLDSVKDDIKRVLKLNPKHVGAMFYAGKYCYQTGSFENAEKFLKRIINDPIYGSKANGVLADIRLKRYNKRFMSTLKVYLSGESFGQALQLCEEALLDMPDNTELLFAAAYSSCMLGKKDRAESYTELYTARSDNQELAAELKTLVDAWFTESFDNQVAIEKFLTLKNKHLLTPIVKRKIKKLLITSKSINRYEDFIKKEIQQPGADKDNLERELIKFMLEQNQVDKAFQLIDKRPTDSLEDNLLYVWALRASNEQIKALSTAKSLMAVAPKDLRVYRAWIEAWLSYTDKNKRIPEGKDYEETIERIFELLRPEKLVNQEPILLINLLRLANFKKNERQCHKIHLEVAKIAFSDEHEKILLKTADELLIFNRTQIAINILESATNQLPENYNLSLKLANVYMESNPASAIQICEEVMQQNPELIRAFITWCDAMNNAKRGGEAISEIVKRLEDPSLNEIVKRQLNLRLESLRMEGNVDTPYEPTTLSSKQKSNEIDDDEINYSPDDSLLEEITSKSANSEDAYTDYDNQSDDHNSEDNSDYDSNGYDNNVDEINTVDDINSYSPPDEEEDYDEELDF